MSGEAGAPYLPGLLALREGALLEAAVRALPRPPEVLLVDATGRDHPRRAGLATHLGAVLDVPTGDHRVGAVIEMSAQHCDGLGTDLAVNCLAAGITTLTVCPFKAVARNEPASRP